MMNARPVLVFHALFGLAALVCLGLVPGDHYGLMISALVLGYHVALVLVAMTRGYREWIALWWFLLPLSVMQVLPDWVLADFVGSLRFYDHGVIRLGAVPAYMAGMWMIPLFLIVRLSDCVSARSLQPIAAMLLAILLFGSSEWYAQPLALWREVGVTHTWLGVALYVLPPEALLGLAAWWGHNITRGKTTLTRIPLAMGISIFYTGMLISSYFLIEVGASL